MPVTSLARASLVDQAVELVSRVRGCGVGATDPLPPDGYRIPLVMTEVHPAGRVEQIVFLVSARRLVIVKRVESHPLQPTFGEHLLAGGGLHQHRVLAQIVGSLAAQRQ